MSDFDTSKSPTFSLVSDVFLCLGSVPIEYLFYRSNSVMGNRKGSLWRDLTSLLPGSPDTSTPDVMKMWQECGPSTSLATIFGDSDELDNQSSAVLSLPITPTLSNIRLKHPGCCIFGLSDCYCCAYIYGRQVNSTSPLTLILNHSRLSL